jgi:predicted RNase H-like HicB family nuclease
MEVTTDHAVYERADDGTIWGYTDDYPGAFGAGDSLDEAKASLREGVRVWLEAARERETGALEERLRSCRRRRSSKRP